jgi:dTDP-glucose 4,6-dehydratase
VKAKIIVTGGAGFIGVNLCRMLVKLGFDVTVIDKLTYAGNIVSLNDLSGNQNFRLVQADICQRELVTAVFNKYNPDAVMHLAAESHVDNSITGPEQFVRTNVNGTYQILESAHSYWKGLSGKSKDKFRFIHVSTDEVFGSLTSKDAPFTETTPYNPRSPYSATKAASDHLARAWMETFRLPVIVTNCSNNYGPYQFPEKLIPVIIIKSLNNQAIPIYGSGENVRDWLYVEDHCSALLSVMLNGVPGETYCIGGNNELRNLDIANMICSCLDKIKPRNDGAPYSNLIKMVSDRPGHDFRYAINSRKIQRDLNWEPKEKLETGINKTVNWYIENLEWVGVVLNRK